MTIQLDDLVTRLILDKSGFETGIKGVTASGQDLKSGLGSVLSAIGLDGVTSFFSITGAIIGTIAVLKSCYSAVMEYSNSIRTISQLTNQSTEDSSRLLHVTGLYKLTVQELEMASRTLATKGLSLTVDEIAKLSDQYLKLNTGAERQAFLTANMGRASANWVNILSQGSKVILAQNAAVNTNLVMTQKEIDLAQKESTAEYNASEAWKGLKVVVGEFLLGPATAVLNWLTKSLDGWNQLFIYLNRYNNGLVGNKTVLISKEPPSPSTPEELKAIQKAQEELRKSVEDRTAWEILYTNAKTAADRTDATITEMGTLIQGILGSTGDEGALIWEGFLKETDKISPAAAAQFVRVLEIYQHVKDMVSGGIPINIIIDYLVNATNAATIGQPPPANSGWKLLGTKNGPGTGSYWENSITGEVHFGSTDTGWSSGGSFTVPPGYPNDSFPMRVQSGEHVQITPAGELQKGDVNITIYNPVAEASEESLRDEMHILSFLGKVS